MNKCIASFFVLVVFLKLPVASQVDFKVSVLAAVFPDIVLGLLTMMRSSIALEPSRTLGYESSVDSVLIRSHFGSNHSLCAFCATIRTLRKVEPLK